MGTIVVTYEASEICEIVDALQCFSDRGCCWSIDKHHLGLFLVDVLTSSLSKIASPVGFFLEMAMSS